MTTPLSLYSSKILGEHPLGHWPLQDEVDFISLLGNSHANLMNWTLTGQGSMEITSTISTPIPSKPVFKINTNNVGRPNIVSVRLESDDIGTFEDIDSVLSTFALASFVYSSTDSLQSITIGFTYDDPTYGQYSVTKRFSNLLGGKWLFLSETFDKPYELSSVFNIFIEIEFLSNSTNDPVFFLINGMSFGQWSEEFNSSSTGIIAEPIVESIKNIPSGQLGVKLLASAESTKDGYSLCSGTRLFARNSGIPMVYGASSSMTLYPNSANQPSMILPGLGFLNKTGQNRNYTFETWIKIDHYNSEDFRIIGPVASNDGIYVNGPFLKLKVGNYSHSHYVGEWYRPMLLHVSISPDRISMLVNGELVGEIVVNRSQLSFPEEVSQSLEQDWIGYYSNDLITLFEVGPTSIYTYPISKVIAKRRWVYGQGVENPESLNVAYGGKSVAIDYQFSKYASNYSYPKSGPWSKGISDNMLTDTDYLKTPGYKKMSIVGQTEESSVLSNLFSVQNEEDLFVRLPDNHYMYMDTINILPDDIETVFGVFKTLAVTDSDQTLLELRDKSSGDYLSVKMGQGSIKYYVSYSGVTSLVAETATYFPGEQFAVGINFDRMASYFGGDLSLFLSKKKSLSIYIGGTSSNDTFEGNIYGVSFCNANSTENLKDYFAPNGLVWDSELVESMLDDADAGLYSTTFWQLVADGGNVAEHAGIGLIENNDASYTVKPHKNLSTMYFDADVSGSWRSSVPLSYFGKYVKKASGDKKYDLDFLQFNVGYPSPASSIAVREEDQEWSYQDLASKFSIPSQKTYSDLDNHLYTGYVDYKDLQNNARQTYKFDTSSSLVRTFVYFKNILDTDTDATYYSNILQPPRDGVIQPGSEWVNTKYEIVDGMIIYPPSNVDFTKTLVFVEVDIKVAGISEKPVAIQNLSISSFVMNDSERTPVGTRYGSDMYPFTQNGFYYDYKSKNPFSIYKGSTPYLYLTKNSGIKLKGNFDSRNLRGIDIPVNSEGVQNYKVIAAQFFAMYDDDFFPYSPTEVFEIISDSSHIKFFIQSTHPEGLRGKIFAINVKTGSIENGIGYYINGKIVKDPVLTIKQWSAIGIGFANYIDFGSTGGSIRITGPLMINNLSYYNSARLQQVQSISVRPWFGVKESGRVKFIWKDWAGIFRWFEVLVLSSRSFYGVDPADIYAAYVGASRIIIDDRSILRLLRSKYRIISNSVTQLFTINSV